MVARLLAHYSRSLPPHSALLSFFNVYPAPQTSIKESIVHNKVECLVDEDYITESSCSPYPKDWPCGP